jgi:hypothetical protein
VRVVDAREQPVALGGGEVREREVEHVFEGLEPRGRGVERARGAGPVLDAPEDAAVSMSTPVASRRWTEQVRTKGESGDIERKRWRSSKSRLVARSGRKSMPVKVHRGSWSSRQPPGSTRDGLSS